MTYSFNAAVLEVVVFWQTLIIKRMSELANLGVYKWQEKLTVLPVKSLNELPEVSRRILKAPND